MKFDNAQLRAVLIFNRAFLDIMCRLFLLEDNPTKEMIIDMSHEIANLTIGSTKVLASTKDIKFRITTPYASKVKYSKKYALSFKLESNKKAVCNVFLS